MQDAYPGVLDGHEGHTPKSCCPVSTTPYTPYLAEIWKISCLDPSLLCASFTAEVQSTIIKKALRITFNSCETVSTSSMALATVNIDKIVKVTSSYV